MSERQKRAPLFEALSAHLKESRGNFHVPGHKQGQAFDPEGSDRFKDVLSIDLTEVGYLDDLHDPEGVIREAQEFAAEAFSADETRFLVGGSTAGNLALVLSLCQPGDRLIIQRNSHQSIFNGCLLAGVRPVYISGDGECSRINPETLAEVLGRFPDAKGVFITSPDYYGMCQPVDALARMCGKRGIPLLVDEAHGAHFGFHPLLPPSAMQQGADAAVQSTHKMLPAMTMASMLHLKGEGVPSESVFRWLRVIQSSSPSYPLMASLDLARRFLAERGKDELDVLLNRLQRFREKLSTLSGIIEEGRGDKDQDPLKLAIRSKRRISGFRLSNELRRKGLFMELADHRCTLAAFSIGTSPEEMRRLMQGLKDLEKDMKWIPEEPWMEPIRVPRWSESRFPLNRLDRLRRQAVSLEEAVGRPAAEMVVPYPPGIPLVLPGESFTRKHAMDMDRMIRCGGRVRGLAAVSPPCVYVLQ
ncbi:aminotransferase class I/II-fold pyridoxal phosphate-dependent enzyme [Paludifilum halophilum]|uniref:Amino acid decarboxylase n=1 Tax=Paludifilum halophilum TaxID=1642702 RepID=A0A235B2C7_9BACL|nr:aminotransferase class I/II-fold pyridoxal phosphate-dependent enzyme [Paludifilum halophilum]OYD06391.1 hypothetical protein CHM34_16935 [Paludifilum halophilum]